MPGRRGQQVHEDDGRELRDEGAHDDRDQAAREDDDEDAPDVLTAELPRARQGDAPAHRLDGQDREGERPAHVR